MDYEVTKFFFLSSFLFLLFSFFFSLIALRIEAASSRSFGRYSGKPDPRQPNVYCSYNLHRGERHKKSRLNEETTLINYEL